MFGTLKAIFKKVRQMVVLIVLNSLLLYFIAHYIPELGFQIIDTQYDVFITYGILGVLFWFINSVIKRIVMLIAFPLKYLTMGLSSVLINIGLFYLFAYVLRDLDIGIVMQLGSIIQVATLSVFLTVIFFIIKKIL